MSKHSINNDLDVTNASFSSVSTKALLVCCLKDW